MKIFDLLSKFVKKCAEGSRTALKSNGLEQRLLELDYELRVSEAAMKELITYESKILRCYGAVEIDKDFIQRKLNDIHVRHMSRFLSRQMNYVEDGGTVLEFSVEYDIERRNDKIAWLLEKYLSQFEKQIMSLAIEDRYLLLKNIKEKQMPKIIEKTVENFTKNVL